MYQDHRNVIAILAKLYPGVFFEDSKQRLPLKISIVNDIENQAPQELMGYDIGRAVDFYVTNIGYKITLSRSAGKFRVGLDGKGVAKVTEAEAQDAQRQVDDYHENILPQKSVPINRVSFLQPPRPPISYAGREEAIRDALSLQRRQSLPDAELVASAVKKLNKAAALLADEDDEFRAEFVCKVLTEARAEFVCKVLTEARADIDAALTKVNSAARNVG
jgi:hypothetical protein